MPNQPKPGSPTEWLEFAYSDLALAKVDHLPHVRRELLCFHAQQAAEKALKVILVAYNLPFPRTHNLRILLDLLPATIVIPEQIANTARLTEYATSSRYPGFPEPIDDDEYQQAIVDAHNVVTWGERIIAQKDDPDGE